MTSWYVLQPRLGPEKPQPEDHMHAVMCWADTLMPHLPGCACQVRVSMQNLVTEQSIHFAQYFAGWGPLRRRHDCDCECR